MTPGATPAEINTLLAALAWPPRREAEPPPSEPTPAPAPESAPALPPDNSLWRPTAEQVKDLDARCGLPTKAFLRLIAGHNTELLNGSEIETKLPGTHAWNAVPLSTRKRYQKEFYTYHRDADGKDYPRVSRETLDGLRSLYGMSHDLHHRER